MDRLHVLIATRDARLAARVHRSVWERGHVAAYAATWEAVRTALDPEAASGVIVLDLRMLPGAPPEVLASLRDRRLVLLGREEAVPGELASAPTLAFDEGEKLAGILSGFLRPRLP